MPFLRGAVADPAVGVVANGQAYGAYHQASSSSGSGTVSSGGTYGSLSYGDTYGAYGSGSTGVYGSGSTYGVYGSGTTGVYGSGTTGMSGHGGSIGVFGGDATSSGVRGDSTYVGVWGTGSSWGVYAEGIPTSGLTYGVFGAVNSTAGFGLYSDGNAHVNGTLSKAAGSFKIDHPLDPENKSLSHSFVESPDMMNVYNGNVVLDAAGAATVALPAYFKALNRDYRYQLTPIGGAAPQLHVATEIQGTSFGIAGGPPGGKVSWQVTGIRKDAYAAALPIVVEQDKADHERGLLAFVPAGSKAGAMRLRPTAVAVPRATALAEPPAAPTP